MSKEEFIGFVDLSFKGQRFDGGRLPVDVLSDLTLFREIVLEIAKNIWRDQHPTRKRLPKNFDDFFKLNLSEITEGSAVATLVREDADLTPLFEDEVVHDIFFDAQEVLVRGIEAANIDGPILGISDELLPKIGGLGKRLGKSEKILISPNPTTSNPRPSSAIFSPSTRERMFQRAGLDFERLIEGFGILTGCHETRSTITIKSELGEFDAKVVRETIRAVFDGRIGSVVEFSVDAILSSDDRIKKIENVNFADLVENGPDIDLITDRITDFGNFRAGWMDGQGEKINPDACKIALDLSRYINSTFEGLRVYPMLNGGVQLEYDIGNIDVSVKIISLRKIELHAYDTESDNLFESKHRGLTDRLLSEIMSLRERLEQNEDE